MLTPAASWRSGMLRLKVTEGPELDPGRDVFNASWKFDLEGLSRAVRLVNGRAELGTLFSSRRRPNRYDEAREQIGNIPSAAVVRTHCSRHGMTTAELVRISIGDLTAIRRGRVLPVGRDEILQTIVWAIEDGLDTSPGWRRRWDSFAARRPYLCTSAYLAKGAKRAGASLESLVAEASQICEVKGHRIEVSRTVVPQVIEAAIDACWTSIELRSHGVNQQKLWRLKEAGKLIGYRLPSRPFLYPKWQFDESFLVRSVASEMFRMVEREKLSLWELHSLVQQATGCLDCSESIGRLSAKKRTEALRILGRLDLPEDRDRGSE